MKTAQASRELLPYIQRAAFCANPTAKELLLIMEQKQTNLAVAIDVTTKEELLLLARQLAPHVAILKTHIDIVKDFDIHLLLELQDIAKKGRCIILEDRKFADIGNTAKWQYEEGLYKIVNWAHLVTAHSIAGPGIVEALRKSGLPMGRGMVLLAEMSSEGNLATAPYSEATRDMAHEYSDFVIGFIAQRRISNAPNFLHITPGVNLSAEEGAFRQRYRTPEEAIVRDGCDLIVVGSGIIHSDDPVGAAKEYREAGWEAYRKRIGLS